MNFSRLSNDWQPMDYEKLMAITGHYKPSPKLRGNKAFRFWQRALIQRAMSVIDVNLPEEWEGMIRDFFFDILFIVGYLGIFEDPQMGIAFQPIGLSGQTFYYQPAKAIVTNPTWTRAKEFQIGKDLAVIKLTPDWMGVWDIVNYYSERLASLDGAIMIAIMNAKFAKLAIAKDKASAEAMKKIYDKIQSGEPFSVIDQKVFIKDDMMTNEAPWNLLQLEPDTNDFILPEILRSAQDLIQGFDSEIGIPSLPYQKKERMVTDEATMKSSDGMARSLTWFKCLESSAKEANRIFPGLDLKFNLHYKDEISDSNPEGDINGGGVDLGS